MPPRPNPMRRFGAPPTKAVSTLTMDQLRAQYLLTLEENPDIWTGSYASAVDAALEVYPCDKSLTSKTVASATSANVTDAASWKTRSPYGWYKLSLNKATDTRDYRPLWDAEKTKIEKMSVSLFNTKYKFGTTIKADDDAREEKYLESIKDVWTKTSVANQNLLEAKYYLSGCRRSANENGTWDGHFDHLEPQENDSDYGEDLGDDYEEEEGEEETV